MRVSTHLPPSPATVTTPHRNRWTWDIGRGKKLCFVRIDTGLNQAGGGITENYATGGLYVDFSPVGLARCEQLIPLRPATSSEFLATDEALRPEWDANAQKLKMFLSETSNTEVGNGLNVSACRFTFMAIGR